MPRKKKELPKKQCICCDEKFNDNPEKDKCWMCEYQEIKKIEMIEYEKCESKKGRSKFCDENDCLFCFKRSFAGHYRSQYIDKDEKIDPRYIGRSSHKILEFNCNVCGHKFVKDPHSVSFGEWCPYHTSQKLCEDNDNCKLCFNKSFASNPKSKEWNYELNKSIPRQVFNQSNKKFWFKCKVCLHNFDIVLNDISKDKWCRYCAYQDLCGDCDFCFKNSFANIDEVKY